MDNLHGKLGQTNRWVKPSCYTVALLLKRDKKNPALIEKILYIDINP